MDNAMLYAEKLAQLIREKTVSSYDETDITRFCKFHDVLKAQFPQVFAVCKVENFNGSLLIKWSGKNSDHPIMFMNHHDVVEAGGEWQYPPFSGEIADGRIWGRGTLDTKGGLFCMLQAAEELMEIGFIPEHDIYFESACTEECSGAGAEKIAQELENRGIYFDWILDEGGMILYDPIGMSDGYFAMIATCEKGCADIKFSAKSNGGHASRPPKNSPIVRLSKFCCAVEKSHIFKRKLSITAKEMLRRMSLKMKQPLKTVLGHPNFFGGLLKLALPLVSSSGDAMMRTTIAFTMSGGAECTNSLPEEAFVVGNMRFSHHQGFEKSLDALKKIAKKYDVEVTVMDPGVETHEADYRNEAFKTMEHAVKAVFDGVVPSPYIAMSASDNRYMSRISDNCFGFTPFTVSDEQLDSIHGLNENLDIDCLPKAVEFYKILMKGGI